MPRSGVLPLIFEPPAGCAWTYDDGEMERLFDTEGAASDESHGGAGCRDVRSAWGERRRGHLRRRRNRNDRSGRPARGEDLPTLRRTLRSRIASSQVTSRGRPERHERAQRRLSQRYETNPADRGPSRSEAAHRVRQEQHGRPSWSPRSSKIAADRTSWWRGHSNTVPKILELLGVPPGQIDAGAWFPTTRSDGAREIDHEDYDDLFVVKRCGPCGKNGRSILMHRNYGTTTPTPASVKGLSGL